MQSYCGGSSWSWLRARCRASAHSGDLRLCWRRRVEEVPQDLFHEPGMAVVPRTMRGRRRSCSNAVVEQRRCAAAVESHRVATGFLPSILSVRRHLHLRCAWCLRSAMVRMAALWC
ncbi:hypothetical protein BS78_01G039100 [Paspalum vaginatum]|nr:hypothetical protein BS78_01G039100 [Paspalum vaginatum]